MLARALTVVTSLSSLPASLAGLDLGQVCAELEAVLRRHGARARPTSLDLLLRHGAGFAMPGTAIATFALEGGRIARAVVSHVRIAPFYAGVALAVHPPPELEAPVLVADLGVPPPGLARLFVDACGPSVAAPGFDARFRGPLAAVLDGARGLRHQPVPAWLAPLSGGCGGRLRASPLGGESAARALVRYVERYLEALDGAPPAKDPVANLAAARQLAAAVRANGRGGKHLERTFDEAFAIAHAKLLWNE